MHLPDNYGLALGRLRSIIPRLKKEPELLKTYIATIKDQIEKGVIEKVLVDTVEGPIKHYCPHHPVITPLKTTTKVHIVYDASAKTNKDNNSLNECLYHRPVILEDLCGMLMRL